MKTLTAQFQRKNIAKIGVFWNDHKHDADYVAQLLGASAVIGGAFYHDGEPVCHLQVDGTIRSDERAYQKPPTGYSAYGFQWDTGPDLEMVLVPDMANALNHISCTTAVVGGNPVTLYYNQIDVGGERPRAAMGTKNGDVVFFSTTVPLSMEECRDHLKYVQGWDEAIILDGGTKVNAYLGGELITAGVKPLYFLYLVEKDSGDSEEEEVVGKKTVYVNPGHGAPPGPGSANGNAALGYLEHECVFDIGDRLRVELERCGVNVVMGRGPNEYPSMEARVEEANQTRPDLYLDLHTNAAGSMARGALCITSSGPDSALRNVAARAIRDEFIAGNIRLYGLGMLYGPQVLGAGKNYYVLTQTLDPAVIIEYGFHTNEGETILLMTPSYRERLARATAKGVCSFLGVPYLGAGEVTPPTEEGTTNKPSAWAEESWLWAYEAGLLDGTDPQGAVTREQLAEVLYRYAQLGLDAMP